MCFSSKWDTLTIITGISTYQDSCSKMIPALPSKICKNFLPAKHLYSTQILHSAYIQIKSETALSSSMWNALSFLRKGQKGKLNTTSCQVFFLNMLLQLPLLELFNTLKETGQRWRLLGKWLESSRWSLPAQRPHSLLCNSRNSTPSGSCLGNSTITCYKQHSLHFFMKGFLMLIQYCALGKN